MHRLTVQLNTPDPKKIVCAREAMPASIARERPRIYASVSFQVPSVMADDAAAILVNDGALGCEVKKISCRSREAKPRSNTVLLQAYVARISHARVKRLKAKLNAAKMLANKSTPEPRAIADPGWATMWQSRFVPLPIGRRFLIVSPWHRGRDLDRIQLVIRPGQAFGTGHHKSTSGTMSVVEKLCERRHIAHALDVGTGSGILAVAMVKLGVREVTAIDIDKVALANARENAKLNGLSGKIRFSLTPLGSLGGRFGLITANILSSTLIRIAPDLKARLRSGGHLVLAGILHRETEAVAAAYRPELSYLGACQHGTWTTMIFQR
jgi:ribosomal protein L11 methyltransferase